MVVDYEAAWNQLGEYVAGKTQHGREGLLIEMQKIAASCRVPAGELSRLLRLYSVEVERARRETRDEDTDFTAGDVSAADDVLPGHHRETVESRETLHSLR